MKLATILYLFLSDQYLCAIQKFCLPNDFFVKQLLHFFILSNYHPILSKDYSLNLMSMLVILWFFNSSLSINSWISHELSQDVLICHKIYVVDGGTFFIHSLLSKNRVLPAVVSWANYEPGTALVVDFALWFSANSDERSGVSNLVDFDPIKR